MESIREFDHLGYEPPGQSVLIFDGACGTSIQRMQVPAAAWEGCEGCNELLSVTLPEAMVAMHRSFLDAGAQVVETNTFGANRIVLAEYGLEKRVAEINRAAVRNARQAVASKPGALVCGSLGPGTKLAILDQVSVEAQGESYAGQVEALVEAGVDLLLFETCQDLLQIKTALIACFGTLERLKRQVPVMVSVTIETTGTLLTGSDIATVVAALEPYPLFSLGLNCATGPREMAEYISYASRNWPGRVSVMPNAGLPRLEQGRTVYDLTPDEFAAHLRRYVLQDGVSVVGGCCGTTPEHIRALAAALQGVVPGMRAPERRSSVTSVYQAAGLKQDIPPFVIGERLNANGSKKFREMLLAGDFDAALKLGVQQENEGAMSLDVCTAYAGRKEKEDIIAMVRRLRTGVKIPLVIDSTTPDCIEAALKLHPGRCIVNSINLEDGGANLDKVCRIAKRYGAAVVALTINEKGMAMTADEKVATARAIYERALGHGLRPSDLLFDALTFTIGSGDETLYNSGVETLNAIRRIKQELPGVFTSLGVSNISFGLAPYTRKLLNSVFLHEAVQAGLDAAIIDVAKIVPFNQIDAVDRGVCLDLIHNRVRVEGETALAAFLRHFSAAGSKPAENKEDAADRPIEALMAEKIVRGEKDGIEEVVDMLLTRYTPNAIINTILVPAMRKVGDLFASGDMLLPFVLQSAEVMKASVGYLERFMDKSDRKAGLKVLLATVQGDVHDIGKNLVDIILSNNGYTVFNLGIKVPSEVIIEKSRALAVDVIGLSGLLVKSALVMQENMKLFQDAGLTAPVLLGGAALTPSFVANDCVPGYRAAPVVYCADAFAGLRALREYEAGTLRATHVEARAAAPKAIGRSVELDRGNPVPTPPFFGVRHVTGIDPVRLFPYMNEPALFRGRWGYRRGKLSAADYETMLNEKVRPLYEEFKRRTREESLIQASVAYGYFHVRAEGNSLLIDKDGRDVAFAFPRQAAPPNLCLADYFKTAEEGGDVAGFFVVTIGPRIDGEIHKLYAENRYHDYLMLHGYSVELTDALAEYWHETMREEWGIGAHRPAGVSGYAAQDYQGSRFGFGYPACPDLDVHKPLFEMLQPEAIGVTLTENMQMVPEQTTSALVAHHPQAKYFAV